MGCGNDLLDKHTANTGFFDRRATKKYLLQVGENRLQLLAPKEPSVKAGFFYGLNIPLEYGLSTMAFNTLMADLVKTIAKEHPLMFVFVLAVAGGSMVYSLQVFAEKDTVNEKFEGVERRIGSLEKKVDLRHMQTQLYSLDSEIYQLERLVSSSEANERDHARLAGLITKRKLVQGDVADLGGSK
ncbi:hypothetical protein OAE19_05225 [Porticoccaceae bacterium]|nr:hypothetical protein [Porticoccaceae bacterium]